MIQIKRRNVFPYTKLREAQDIKVIGSAYDYMLSEDLFYDTLYHLNSEGIETCTKLLAQQIVPFIE